jgi:hypothetical protein
MDPDPDPVIFVIDLQDANKKIIYFKNLLLIILLFEGAFTSFFKNKSRKVSQNISYQGFSYYFA